MKKKKWWIGIILVGSILASIVIVLVSKSDNNQTEIQTEWEYVSDETSDGIREWITTARSENEGFPQLIEGTELILYAILPFDGVFYEDGADKPIENVSTILLQNQSEEFVEYARIVCNYGATEHIYEASTLEPGAMIVVQESNGATYMEGTPDACTASVAYMNEEDMASDEIKVEVNALGKVRVTNKGDADIPCVRIFYKFYLSDVNVWIGGITYTAKLTDVKAGEARVISPSHFSNGLSRIMMVRTYDTTE